MKSIVKSDIKYFALLNVDETKIIYNFNNKQVLFDKLNNINSKEYFNENFHVSGKTSINFNETTYKYDYKYVLISVDYNDNYHILNYEDVIELKRYIDFNDDISYYINKKRMNEYKSKKHIHNNNMRYNVLHESKHKFDNYNSIDKIKYCDK